MRLHPFAARLLITSVLGVSCGLTSCNERSQDLDERVTQLQKQLDQTQTELQAANQSLKTAKDDVARLTKERARPEPAPPSRPPPAAPVSTLPSKDALEKTYTAKAKVLKQDLQGKLKQYKLDTCTLYQIDVTPPEYPVTSKISLALRTNTGGAFHLDVPVKADRSGNWIFPDSAEILQRIEEIGRTAATARSAPVPASAPATVNSGVPVAPQTGRSGTGQRADKTVVIQWPGSTPAPAQQQPPPQPQQQPAAAAPAAPTRSSAPVSAPVTVSHPGGGGAPGLPADRTVTIQWPDGGKTSGSIYQPNRSTVPPGREPEPARTQSPADRSVLAQF